jgi:hypothetical protein
MATLQNPTSLIDLAAAKRLPPIQHMDRETLAWMQAHRPQFTRTGTLPALNPVLSTITVPEDWLLEPKLRNSLHGIRHGLRCAVFAALLAADLSEAEQHAAIIAAALHDCGRLNDQGDEGHGARSAKWFAANSQAVLDHFSISLPVELVLQMETAVAQHDIPYTDEPTSILTDIVKTADALDRYRLPKLKWWLDDQLVRLKPSSEMKAFAFDLAYDSEMAYLDGAHSETAVRSAFVAIGGRYGLA